MEGLEHSPEHWESRSPPHTYLCLPSQLVNSILLLSCIQSGGWEGLAAGSLGNLEEDPLIMVHV